VELKPTIGAACQLRRSRKLTRDRTRQTADATIAIMSCNAPTRALSGDEAMKAALDQK
jgi:hypothetical protein